MDYTNFYCNIKYEVYTLDDYMCETDSTIDDVKSDFGFVPQKFIWAMLHSTPCVQRFFAPILNNSSVAIANAIQQVTALLLDEYKASVRNA